MLKRFFGFWTQEHSLTALLAVLVIRLFVLIPVTGGGLVVGLVGDVLFCLFLLSGLRIMALRRSITVFFAALILLSAIVRLVSAFVDLPHFRGLDFVLSTLALLGILMVALVMVYHKGPVTAHRIRGAIAAYLLLGVLFARVYMLIDYCIPGAFSISPALARPSPEYAEAFNYFSVVTLTTVGFGDVTPVASVARSFVMIEAFIGQLYPAILIARLVSLSLVSREQT